jgi:hypothetical protein
MWTATTIAQSLNSIQAATATDLWLAGASWLVERGAGPTFSTIPTGLSGSAPNTLRALFVLPSGEAWVGGDRQTLLHHL